MAIGWIKEAAELGIKVFGDVNYRGPCPLETPEQISFFALLDSLHPDLGAVAVHIENEGRRSKFLGAKKKINGLKKGACDIFIPCDPPILIELKRRDPSKSSPSADQIKYMINARAVGASVCIALGAAGAIDAVNYYTER